MHAKQRFALWFTHQLARHGWREARAAAEIGVSAFAIRSWSTGVVPHPEGCRKIARGLGIDVSVVLAVAGHSPDEGRVERPTLTEAVNIMKAVLPTEVLVYDRLARGRIVGLMYVDLGWTMRHKVKGWRVSFEPTAPGAQGLIKKGDYALVDTSAVPAEGDVVLLERRGDLRLEPYTSQLMSDPSVVVAGVILMTQRVLRPATPGV